MQPKDSTGDAGFDGKRILFLNMIAETVGDTLLLTPAFRVIKQQFPRAKISVTVPIHLKELYDHNPHLDEIIVIKDLDRIGMDGISRFKKFWIYICIIRRLAKELRKKHYDACFVTVPNFVLMPLIPWLAKIPRRIGYSYPGSRLDFLLTEKTPFISWEDNPHRHYVEAYLDLLRLAGVKIRKDDLIAEKAVSADDLRKADQILKEQGITKNDTVMAFQTGAKWTNRRWHSERFAEVAAHFVKKGIHILLLGSAKERELNEKINKTGSNRMHNLCGKVDLSTSSALLKRCSVVLANDSGLAHLASAVGATTVVIYGSTSPAHSRPYGRGRWIGLHNKDAVINITDSPDGRRELDRISTRQVIVAMDDALSQTKKTNKRKQT